MASAPITEKYAGASDDLFNGAGQGEGEAAPVPSPLLLLTERIVDSLSAMQPAVPQSLAPQGFQYAVLCFCFRLRWSAIMAMNSELVGFPLIFDTV